MKKLWKWFNSQLRYQIVMPFLILTTVVTVVGGLLVLYFLAQSLNERIDNQLATITRAANDAVVTQEDANLQFLRQIAFSPGIPESNIPSTGQALARNDRQGFAASIDPYFRLTRTQANIRSIDRLIAFNQSGQTIVDFEYPSGVITNNYVANESFDARAIPFVDYILSGEDDEIGDKFAGIATISDVNYFITVAPVYYNDEIVGGLIAAMRLDSLLVMLRDRSQAGAMSIHDQTGAVLNSTLGDEVGTIKAEVMQDFWTHPDVQSGRKPVYDIEKVGQREFKFSYVPLTIRNDSFGILAPAVINDFALSAWESTFWPVVFTVVLFSCVIIVVGISTANFITRPLEHLVQTAKDVASGKLDRRASVKVDNEIGQLATSFNTMTEYLIQLYDQVQAEAVQRAAIVDSITDGIVVVDDQGVVQLINRATRHLMGLADDAPPPRKLSDIPMEKLVEGVPGFGTQRAQDLYNLGEYIVRASIAPVVGSDNVRSGYVCVLQDMTAEVAVDRAKTNFIGTISHELKTPLTVIGGNADLLLRGLAGKLEDDQASFVETIRLNANNMASLLQNVILVADLDAGVTTIDLAPVELMRPVDEARWRVQSQIKAKGLALNIQIPSELAPVLADFDHVRQVVSQLLDNARRYTSAGSITVRALDQGDHVRVEVEDTGRGVAPDMQEQIFHRFIRGDGASEGINSAERGIGLGLAISKQLVERQGGTIGVESTPGQGSTFYFTLRYANDPSSPEKAPSLAAAD
ncbi:MAG: HAMP domain-containing protein [Candidatus Viridilinea halotolerans]|uniref:histidine kinase n=1 Tax=Candidatus Viridilinea halotolerans TaxID=2491704 RepID=A0A426TQE1_9CHLR|nr:MAG: HAMP domain-containing protein [Candidatus Viridilinea halotolerans]